MGHRKTFRANEFRGNSESGCANPPVRPASPNGVIYAGGEQNPHALYAASGEARWTTDFINANVAAGPTVADGVVYVGGNDNYLYAVAT
ncbi:PQQ-binding-like beta-propeller repeat protein [Saccharopolyspora sp. NPDC050642]|uniref:outer membrane protein assembly factor BamB family protein n=1 Tax=Saccharopolyspora sp. NPDC050642 TaxID=3157099 RepID=UPI0033F83717